MKIQKIQQLCKAAKRILIINGTSDVQWISDGYCIYPLFNLPRLSRENVFAMFDIPADKQSKIFFDERDTLPENLNFDDTVRAENVVVREPYSIYAYGRCLTPIKCSQGAVLIDTKYLAPFAEDVTLYERTKSDGAPYIAVKEGMLLAGIIIPYDVREDFGEWLVNIGEMVVTTAENVSQRALLEEDEE